MIAVKSQLLPGRQWGCATGWVLLALLIHLPAVQAQNHQGPFYYSGGSTNTTAITGWGTGYGVVAVVPSVITNLPPYTLSVTGINFSAFKNQSSITSLTIPNSIVNIGGSAFYGCTGLTNVSLGSGLTNLGTYVFSGCTHVPRIILPDSLTVIPGWTFQGCSALSSVTLGSQVTSIAAGAFENCASLPNISIPSTATNIGAPAFDGCSSLTSITVDSQNPVYTSVTGVVFDSNQTTLLTCPPGKTGLWRRGRGPQVYPAV